MSKSALASVFTLTSAYPLAGVVAIVILAYTGSDIHTQKRAMAGLVHIYLAREWVMYLTRQNLSKISRPNRLLTR